MILHLTASGALHEFLPHPQAYALPKPLEIQFLE